MGCHGYALQNPPLDASGLGRGDPVLIGPFEVIWGKAFRSRLGTEEAMTCHYRLGRCAIFRDTYPTAYLRSLRSSRRKSIAHRNIQNKQAAL